MLSRVAESLYWMSRYIERAENIARIIDVNDNLALDSPLHNISRQWQPLIETNGDEEEFEKKYGDDYSQENVMRFLTFDETNPNSIISCVNSARFNARTVRECISPEMWEEINNLYLYLNAMLQAKPTPEELSRLYEYIRKFSHTFIGLSERTLLQDEGWCFIRLGRLLERADKITRILDVKYFILLPSVGFVNTSYDDIQWAALLKSASAFEPYRKKHSKIEYDRIIEFLIMEKSFPRSVAYCIANAEDMIKRIDTAERSLSLFRANSLNAELKLKTVADIKFYGLHEYLDYMQQRVNDIGNAIYKDFFFLSFA